MDAYSGWMATGSAIQGVSALGGAYAQAEALKTQGEYQRTMLDINARFMRIQGADTLKRAEKSVSKIKQAGKKAVGSQRAALAAQGISVDAGTAVDLQVDTEEAVMEDIMTTRNNAWREAFGFQVQGNQMEAQGRMGVMGARAQAGSTLLTGGLSALAYGSQSMAYGSKARARKVDGYSGARVEEF